MMNRITEIEFMKNLPALGVVGVKMDQVCSIVLHDIMLSEFVALSQSLPALEKPAGNGPYEVREAIVRVMDRLSSRPNQRSAKSSMKIDGKKLSVAEVDAIRCALRKLANKNDKELLKYMRVSGSNLSVQVRRDAINKMLKHAETASSTKIPGINPEDFKGEKGPAPCCPPAAPSA
jgi:hypothetical protein